MEGVLRNEIFASFCFCNENKQKNPNTTKPKQPHNKKPKQAKIQLSKSSLQFSLISAGRYDMVYEVQLSSH